MLDCLVYVGSNFLFNICIVFGYVDCFDAMIDDFGVFHQKTDLHLYIWFVILRIVT